LGRIQPIVLLDGYAAMSFPGIKAFPGIEAMNTRSDVKE